MHNHCSCCTSIEVIKERHGRLYASCSLTMYNLDFRNSFGIWEINGGLVQTTRAELLQLLSDLGHFGMFETLL